MKKKLLLTSILSGFILLLGIMYYPSNVFGATVPVIIQLNNSVSDNTNDVGSRIVGQWLGTGFELSGEDLKITINSDKPSIFFSADAHLWKSSNPLEYSTGEYYPASGSATLLDSESKSEWIDNGDSFTITFDGVNASASDRLFIVVPFGADSENDPVGVLKGSASTAPSGISSDINNAWANDEIGNNYAFGDLSEHQFYSDGDLNFQYLSFQIGVPSLENIDLVNPTATTTVQPSIIEWISEYDQTGWQNNVSIFLENISDNTIKAHNFGPVSITTTTKERQVQFPWALDVGDTYELTVQEEVNIGGGNSIGIGATSTTFTIGEAGFQLPDGTIVEDTGTSTEVSAIIGALQTRFPFAYFWSIQNAWEQAGDTGEEFPTVEFDLPAMSGNATTTITIFSSSTLVNAVSQENLDLFKNMIGWVIWIGVLMYIWGRVKHFKLRN